MKTITVTVDVEGQDLIRMFSVDEDVLENQDYWGNEIVDMIEVIKESTNHKF